MLRSLKRRFKPHVLALWERAGCPLASLGRRRGWAAALYYTFFSRQFWREQQAFLAGQEQYRADVKQPSGTLALLRRNVHRLEKGLLMRPRRRLFALDYIDETVASLERAYDSQSSCVPVEVNELKWAQDVIGEYLSVMPHDDRFNQLRKRFKRVAASEPDSVRYVPYQRDLSKPPSVAYDQLLELCWRRRSVRWFLPKPVPREVIDRAIVAGALSPSACNRQPFVFRVVDEPNLLAKVAGIPFGLQGYGHNVPVLCVLVGRQRNYFHERDRHLIYIDASLAAMAFVLALEAQGVGSCCVNWPDLADREEKMARTLGLDPDERPIMLIALGFPDPDGMVAYSRKKALSQVRRYNLSDDNQD